MTDPAAWYDEGVAAARVRLTTALEAVRHQLGSTPVFVTGRIKTRDSFLEKMARKGYTDPAIELPDLVGIRVAVSRAHEVDMAADQLRERASAEGWAVRELVSRGEEPSNAGVPGYRATHMVIEMDDRHLVEIQMMTVLQHAWAALQHDLVYKGAAEPSHIRRATALAGLLELAEKEFEDLRLSLSAGLERIPTVLAGPDDVTQLVRAMVGDTDPGPAGTGREYEFSAALLAILESLALTQRSHILDMFGDAADRNATIAKMRSWRPWMNPYATVDFLLRLNHPRYFELRSAGDRKIRPEDRHVFEAEVRAFRDYDPGLASAAEMSVAPASV